MERYTWSFDGVEYGLNRRPVALSLTATGQGSYCTNGHMMTHPMHLHGMWSELESPDGQFLHDATQLPMCNLLNASASS